MASLLTFAHGAAGLPHQAGDLDAAFAADGTVTTAFSSGDELDRGNDVLVEPSGTILVAGFTFSPPPAPSGGGRDQPPPQPQPGTGQDFALVRYRPDGSLDPSLAGTGRLVIPVANGDGNDYAEAITRQPDGKILLAGPVKTADGSYDFAVVRLHPDGKLDESFDGPSGDGNGIVRIGVAPANGNDLAMSMTLFFDDIVVAGSSTTNDNPELSVIRLNSDGTLDTSFDGDSGAGDGKVIIAGTTDLERAYDVETALIKKAKGKAPSQFGLVLTGQRGLGSSSNFLTARIRANGTLDTSFSSDGIAVQDEAPGRIDQANAAVTQKDGRIVVAGFAERSYGGGAYFFDITLLRYRRNGTLDDTFSGDGIVHTRFHSGTPSLADAILRQPDGKYVVSGWALGDVAVGTDFDFALVRYLPGGTPDKAFGEAGRVRTDLEGGSTDEAFGIALTPDAKQIVAAGSAFVGANEDFAAARYFTNADEN
jgi:uncharacterized delta-60 repeat protein